MRDITVNLPEPLKEFTLELDESQVNDLLDADVLIIGNVKWYKHEIVKEALAQYAKKKIKELSHTSISEGRIGELTTEYINEIIGKDSYNHAPGWHFEKGLRKLALTKGVKPMSEESKRRGSRRFVKFIRRI